MAQRYIYLSDELNNKLKSEENASALITKLLIKHYEQKEFRSMTEQELKLFIQIEKMKKELAEKIAKLEDGD